MSWSLISSSTARSIKSVVVRPDGVISLPGKGEMRAIDLRPMDLARDIGKRYVDIAQEPVVTVSVRKFTAPADELVDVVRTGTEGRSRSAIIRPDGLVDLPLATAVTAAGLTPADLQAQLDSRYERTVGGVTTTVRVTGIAASQIFVFGEVKNPGAIPATSPRTLIQTIALACQSALNSFQVTAPKSFQLFRPVSAVFCAA